MESWNLSALGKLADISYGYTAKASFEIDGPKFLRITDIQEGDVDWNKVPSCEIDASDYIKHKLRIGDIVFARTGATTGKSFLISKCENSVAASYLIRVRLIDQTVDPEYLYMFFQSAKYWDVVNAGTSGSAQGGFNASKLSRLEIPYPLIPEQKRIVDTLDKAFAAIDEAKAKTEQNLKNARELFDSYLQQVFSQRGEGWVEKVLGKAVIVERGSSPRPIKKYQTNSDDGVNWIKIGDAKEGQKYITRTKEKITKEGAEKSRFVDVGDFILSNSMSFGRPYIMAIPGYIHDGWFVLRLPDDIDSEYFYYLLSSPYLKDQFHDLAAGAIVKNISGDLVKKALLPLPPIEKQKEIASKLSLLVQDIERLEEIYTHKSKQIDELKKSLLQKAFSGELTTKQAEEAVA